VKLFLATVSIGVIISTLPWIELRLLELALDDSFFYYISSISFWIIWLCSCLVLEETVLRLMLSSLILLPNFMLLSLDWLTIFSCVWNPFLCLYLIISCSNFAPAVVCLFALLLMVVDDIGSFAVRGVSSYFDVLYFLRLFACICSSFLPTFTWIFTRLGPFSSRSLCYWLINFRFRLNSFRALTFYLFYKILSSGLLFRFSFALSIVSLSILSPVVYGRLALNSTPIFSPLSISYFKEFHQYLSWSSLR